MPKRATVEAFAATVAANDHVGAIQKFLNSPRESDR